MSAPVCATETEAPDGAPFSVLIVDDNPVDAGLSLMELRRGGIVVEAVTAVDEASLRIALRDFVPDVILCDFSFPGFDGLAAQRMIREILPATPLIFVTGTITEQRAVAALHSGAVDYVLKSNLIRLPSAVRRVVDDARRRARLETSLRRSEERSRRHGERLESLWRIANQPGTGDVERRQAMLCQAALAIRPGHDFRGVLWRIQGSDLIVEAATADEAIGGRVIPLAGTLAELTLDGGRSTRSWDDLRPSALLEACEFGLDTRSCIVTTFDAGGSAWGLSFASDRPAIEPLNPQELTFVEIVATFFANRAQQRWQFDRLQYQQSHDVLTGVLNRSHFRSQARDAAVADGHVAIILIDVDTFHEVNETYGPMTGDAVLVEVASAIRERTFAGETVGRVGGDVFAVLVPGATSREAVLGRAAQLTEAFQHGFSTGDRNGETFVTRTASIGIAMASGDGAGIDELLGRADAALSAAKERGRASIAFYESGMEGDAQRRSILRNELIEAIALDQFTLHYQPHVEIASGRVIGCEALIRWNHPERGLVGPCEFIPFAEQAGIITSIDAWVMRHAFAAAQSLCERRPGFRLYFNLSGRQAGDPKLLRTFVDAARSGVNLRDIGVEITESDAMRDVESTRRVCRALRRLGVTIALDDFGTGYSSLSFLQRLQIDVVKIDRSFVSRVLTNAHDGAITDAIISIADRFGYASLGEGAETVSELDWLRNHGCRLVQGYAICRPLAMDDLLAWLGERDAGSAVV